MPSFEAGFDLFWARPVEFGDESLVVVVRWLFMASLVSFSKERLAVFAVKAVVAELFLVDDDEVMV